MLKYLWFIGLFLFQICSAGQVKPNILYIMADDCTHLDLGTYGGQAFTPNLDQLASEGMKFERCFQTAPMCSPTRHTVYTGLYPVKSGAYTNHTFAYDDVKSIVHYLKPLGYRVALNGKSHVGPKEVFPFERAVISGEERKTSSMIDMVAAEEFIRECTEDNQPFALFACSNEPHTPWSKGEKFRSKYDLSTLKLRPYMVDSELTREYFRNYLAEISFFDEEIGTLLAMLEKHGVSDNTLVMVVSEQGNNFPFAKWSCYDAGLQSGMVIRWPGQITAGSITDAMVEYVDICPTFVEAAGSEPPSGIDGKSFLSVLKGESQSHKQYVFGLQTSRGIFSGPKSYPIRSIRNEKYKLILNLDPEAEFFNSINKTKWFREWNSLAASGDERASWVVERFKTRPAIELYDILQDPHEGRNLAEDPEYSSVVEELSTRLKDWMKSQGDQGLESEMKAFERMYAGNPEYKAWAEANGYPNKGKGIQ